MFYLYCLPGRIFAQIGYLWPGKGQLWASGRRRDSTFVHFLYATAFWGILLWLFVLPYFVTPMRAPTRENQGGASGQTSLPLTGTDDQTRFQSKPEEVKLEAEDVAPVGRHEKPRRVEDLQETASATKGSNDDVRREVDLLAMAAVQQAMHKAFTSGKAERWREGKLRGYAVPSELVVAGCRTMAVSNDKSRDAIAQTKICE